MKVWRALGDVPPGLHSVVTVGNFDGMHRGHQEVVGTCVREARARGVAAVGLTFYPHPVQVHRPEAHLQLIASLQDRLEAMDARGLDATLVARYDARLYRLTPLDFARRYLVAGLGAACVVVGQDFRFGANNSGDVATLRRIGRELGFGVHVVTDIVDEHGRRWSSSWVRELLARGDVEQAAHVLGRDHRVHGRVVHGQRRGRRLGFPTANIEAPDLGVLPTDGVYAGWLVRSVSGSPAREFLPAAISVGTNPQFGGERRTLEAHVLGRADLDLYGEDVAVTFVSRVREQRVFASVEGLLDQMDDDLRRVAGRLGVAVAGRVDPGAVTAR